VSLITCCSAKDNAVGAQVVLCRPRGVIHITQGVIDKAGLNWLLVPHQSPFSPLNQSSLLLLPCLPPATPTPTPFHSIPSIMVWGKLPPPRSPSIVNISSRRGVLGALPTLPLWMSTEGRHRHMWRLIHSMICIWQTSLSPTKGGGNVRGCLLSI
jgi:hypothetical protein